MDVDEKDEKKERQPTVIEQYPFYTFCLFLERVSKQTKSTKKRNLLEALWKDLKSHGGKQFYPLMRLLLPQLDLERGGYGVKEKKIADLYVKAIPLPSQSHDAKKLHHFKNPRYAGIDVGDFTNCLYSVLRDRCIGMNSATKSLYDVNRDLEELQKECDAQSHKVRWFQRLMTTYTALENKWLMRIVLKDLKCGVRHESCLKAFHANALDTYNMTSSLLKVCDMINNPQSHLGRIQIELFHPIKPMLASRRHWNQVISVMKGRFGIEIKFDGERVMLHYKRDDDKLMLWSRNCIDLEKKYGYVQGFGDVLKQQIRCDSCILDGEMMSYDEDMAAFIPFGSNRTVVQAQNEDNAKACSQHLCYMAFDILMINGEITMDLTLSRRREILKNAFECKPLYFEVTKMVEGMESTKDIMDALDGALQDHHEGIMVKALNSVYECNKRGSEWIKLKPDYVDGLVGSMDLLILGGYFGEGKRRVGDISHFLLGCRGNTFYKEDEDDEDDENRDLPTQFYTFCKVGSGYKIEELAQLQQHLRAHWKPFKRKHGLAHLMGWQPQPDDVPDVWIEPSNSVIVELLANEIVTTKNNKFAAGLTVRFPRCKRFRYDKAWFECISLKEIEAKFNDKSNFHHKRTAAEIALLNEENEPRKKRRKTTRSVPSIMGKFRPADTSKVDITSEMLEGKEFCVLNGMEMMNSEQYTKQELEKLIVANGGIITQNPLILSTEFLIAEKITPRVNNIIKSDRWQLDVIRPLWLIQCVDAKRLLPLAPTFMIHSTRKTQNQLQQQYDRFGDHYARPTNVDTLREVLRKMQADDGDDDGEWLKKEWQISDDEEMLLIGGYNRFRRCKVYVDYEKESSSLRMVEARLQLYGANIAKQLDVTVTHIVVDKNHSHKPRHRLKAIRDKMSEMMNDSEYKWRPYLVTAQWVEDSIRSSAVIEEYHKYVPWTLSFPQHS
eukprot:21959_1